MIELILDRFNYVKCLKTDIENLRNIVDISQDSLVEANKKNRELENINIGLKAQIRELKLQNLEMIIKK